MFFFPEKLEISDFPGKRKLKLFQKAHIEASRSSGSYRDTKKTWTYTNEGEKLSS